MPDITMFICSLAHNIDLFMENIPSYVKDVNQTQVSANESFPSSVDLEFTIPYEKETEMLSILRKYALQFPMVNKGAENPARWMKFLKKGFDEHCVSNIYCFAENSDDEYIDCLVSY